MPFRSPWVWFYFFAPVFIWGFSFQMIKWGLESLDAYQLASLRLMSAGAFLLPVAIKHRKMISMRDFGWIAVTYFCSSFLPFYLFCIAETRIDAATAGILNSLTPLWALVIGVVLFKHRLRALQTTAVILGLGFVILIILSENEIKNASILHLFLIVLATVGYAISLWVLQRKLANVSVSAITSTGLLLYGAIAAIHFFFLSNLQQAFENPAIWKSIGTGVFLGVASTAVAGFLFNILIKKSSAVFASLVAYVIPIVAILVGLFVEERITIWQLVGIVGILFSIYIAQRSAKPKA